MQVAKHEHVKIDGRQHLKLTFTNETLPVATISVEEAATWFHRHRRSRDEQPMPVPLGNEFTGLVPIIEWAKPSGETMTLRGFTNDPKIANLVVDFLKATEGQE